MFPVQGVETFLDQAKNVSLVPRLSCTKGLSSTEARWDLGERFYKSVWDCEVYMDHINGSWLIQASMGPLLTTYNYL
jgi:hypothetical protein